MARDWITEYLDYADYTEAPAQFHFWTAVSVIAGALRRKVWLDMGHFKWHPNFYIFFVAPPGIVAKSTTMSIGEKLLKQIDDIKFGPANAPWQAFVQKVAEARIDYVVEATGDFLTQSTVPMCAVTVNVSELGTFLDPSQREQVDVLSDLWDGRDGVWEKVTKTQGDDSIPNPFINIIGCTTPSWIARNIDAYFHGGGLQSRSVFVFAEKKRRLIPYPYLVQPPDMTDKENKLVSNLKKIASLQGGMQLTKEAEVWGSEWYIAHNNNPPPANLQDDKFGGYLSRKPTHLHKLAMIFSAARGDSLTITVDDMESSLEQLEIIEKDMPKVFNQVTAEKEVEIAKKLLQYLTSTGPTTRAELYQAFSAHYSWATYDRVISGLVSARLVVATQKKSGITYTRKGT